MNVQRYEGMFRYLVESEGTDKDVQGSAYLVDLSENGGIGFCGCRNWLHEISPRITRGELPTDLRDPLFNCKHLMAARDFMEDEIFWRLMEVEPPHDARSH